MRKTRQWEARIRKRAQRWLIPRTEAGVVTMKVELEGTDEMIASLDRIAQRLDEVREKANATQRALDEIGGRHELE